MSQRCPMCGSTALDEPRSLVPYDEGVPLVYLMHGKSADAAYPTRYTRVKGRACVECGHVALMVDPQKLRAKLMHRPG